MHNGDTNTKEEIELSIVAPVYNNHLTIEPLHERLTKILKTLNVNYEIIFVNDASLDNSLDILKNLINCDPHLKVIDIQKNSGQQMAVLTGLKYCSGDWIVVMDADLQDPPEAIPNLYNQALTGYHAVFAVRTGKHQPFFRRLTSLLFKTLQKLLVKTPAKAGMFFLISRSLKQQLLNFRSPSPSLISMIGWTKHPIGAIAVKREIRTCGISAYNFRKRFCLGYKTFAVNFCWRFFPKLLSKIPENKIPFHDLLLSSKNTIQ
jgi:glycosyltransferase involved in cell wall biosynthesis